MSPLALPSDGQLQGTVAIVTGASSGIGLNTAEALYRGGAHVVMAGRNRPKTEKAMADIKSRAAISLNVLGSMEYMHLDLSSLTSVRQFAATFLARRDLPLHLLINNAGIIGDVAGLKSYPSPDGFEIVFATNYLGHFLLTQLLLPRLIKTGMGMKSQSGVRKTARVVNVASSVFKLVRIYPNLADQGRMETSKQGWQAYIYSKLFNVAFTVELARRLKIDGLHEHVETFACTRGSLRQTFGAQCRAGATDAEDVYAI